MVTLKVACTESHPRPHRAGLAAFLKAIGHIIPLMDAEHANYYTREVMIILIREFSTPDEEMKKIVLKVPGGRFTEGRRFQGSAWVASP